MTILIDTENRPLVPLVLDGATNSLKEPSITLIEELTDISNINETAMNDQPSKTIPRNLIVAPYFEPEHQLDLNSVDKPYQLLAEALTLLSPAVDSYAITPYSTCLNWPEVFASLKCLAVNNGLIWKRTEFYVVEFRSKLKANINNPLLFKLDKESHREATASGGLLKYWFGSPDQERRNLATCLWRSKEDAILGGKGPWHKQARGVTDEMYETINVKGLKLVVEDDVNSWRFEHFGL